MPLTPRQWVDVMVVLLLGSAATLIPKILVRTPCGPTCIAPDGSDLFNAPLYSASLIFVGGVATRLWECATQSPADSHPKSWRIWCRLLPPAVVSLIAATAQLFSLEHISGAVLAGLRGGLILFTAVAGAVIGLPDAPKTAWTWSMAAGSGAAAALIAVAAALNAAGASAVGVVVCLGAYAAVAVQFVLEQRLVKGAKALPAGVSPFTPGQILAAEGGLSIIVSLPVWVGVAVAFSRNTDTAASWPLDDPTHVACCFTQRPVPLVALSLAYALTSATFNLMLLRLSSVGATLRAFLFTARGAITWVVELTLWYAADGADGGTGAYGEPFGRWGGLQLFGYALLGVCGVLQCVDADTALRWWSMWFPGRQREGVETVAAPLLWLQPGEREGEGER